MVCFNSDLPVEVLNSIFAEVPQQDLLACCLVNQLFNALSTPYLYRILSLNLFYFARHNTRLITPPGTQPERPTPRDHVISSLGKILGAGVQRAKFILSGVRKIEVYGVENYHEEHVWAEQYREMGQLYPLEVNISDLLIRVLSFARGVREFIWDIDLTASIDLIAALREHPSVKSVLFTTVCLVSEYQREYDLDNREDDYPEYAAERAIRRRGREPNPSLPLQDPMVDPTGFRNLVVLGIHHIGNWKQALAINSVIKECIKTLRSLSLRPCGMCEAEYTNDCKENGDLLIKLLDMSGTGELLKLNTLELDAFEFHKKAGRYIDFGVLESFAVDCWHTGNLQDFWDFWVNGNTESGPRNFPRLKRFRFVANFTEDDEEVVDPLLSIINLLSLVPNGLQIFELKYDAFQKAEVWQDLLNGLHTSSRKTLQTLIFLTIKECPEPVPIDVLEILLGQSTHPTPPKWESLETLLIEPPCDKWDTFTTAIAQLPKLTTVLLRDRCAPSWAPIFGKRYDRCPTNRFGRLEPPAGLPIQQQVGRNMADAEKLFKIVFPNPRSTKYIGIMLGNVAGRCFYRCFPEAGVTQVREEEFVAATGTRGAVRWVGPAVDGRTVSDLFNIDLPAWGQSGGEINPGGYPVVHYM